MTARLTKTLQRIRADPPPGISVTPDSEVGPGLFRWTAQIKAPDETPYAGGTFDVVITHPNDYPAAPPKVTLKTKVFHPNVAPTGECFFNLEDEWSPAISPLGLLVMVQAMLGAPDPDRAVDMEVAHLYKVDRREFNRKAMDCTRKYAMQESDTNLAPSEGGAVGDELAGTQEPPSKRRKVES